MVVNAARTFSGEGARAEVKEVALHEGIEVGPVEGGQVAECVDTRVGDAVRDGGQRGLGLRSEEALAVNLGVDGADEKLGVILNITRKPWAAAFCKFSECGVRFDVRAYVPQTKVVLAQPVKEGVPESVVAADSCS